MEPAAEDEEDLNRWYAQEHLPDRMAISGFIRARRYVSEEGEPKYLALYDLDNAAVLHAEGYLQVVQAPTRWTQRVTGALRQFLRNEYELVQSIGESQDEDEAPYLLAVRVEAEPRQDATLNAWYEQEHLPAIASVPGVIAARRYRATEGSPRYLATYELSSPDVRSSEAWRIAGDTPGTAQVRPHFRNLATNLGRLLAVRR
jgi:hypothetical protein